MNMAKNGKQFNEGKLPKVWDLLVRLHKTNPQVFENPVELKREVAKTWQSLNDPKLCPNCEESMQEYIHKLDFFNALLLKNMGDIVMKRMEKGMTFEKANMVHVVSSDFHDCVRHRTTQCRTLGLIAKVKGESGTHDRDKGWLITSRGFAALRGEMVPSEIVAWRNRIEERPGALTNIDKVFEEYKGENKTLIGQRDPMRWVNFAGLNQGKML